MDKTATRGFITNGASATHRCSWSRDPRGAAVRGKGQRSHPGVGVNFEELLMVVGFGQDLLLSCQKVVVREVGVVLGAISRMG